MTTPVPGGQVTIADLFRVMSAMQADVAKVAMRLEVIDARTTAAGTVDSDHETRLRALESFRWKLVGLALVLPALVGFLAAWLPSHVH